jgi:HSP20 family protein
MASRFLTPYSSSRSWMQDPLFQLQREIDRVFEDVFSGGGSGGGNTGGRSGSLMSAPRIDLQDSEGELRLHADLPGVQPSDLDVRVEGDVLTIRGERKSESERNEQNFHVMERSHGRFQRSIQLPFAPDPDQVQASVREGVLELRIPKRAPQERSRRIEVRGAGSSGGQSMTGAISGGGGAGASSSQSVGSGSSSGGGASSSGGATSGGMAGVSGGPTAVPAGETGAKR